MKAHEDAGTTISAYEEELATNHRVAKNNVSHYTDSYGQPQQSPRARGQSAPWHPPSRATDPPRTMDIALACDGRQAR
jgi:hypothetical protein